MSDKYDIFFAGKLVDGYDEATVRANVAKLFKANAQTLEKLFSGKPQLIKRGVDKPAAIKYKSAMQKAGAVPLIRAHGATGATPKAAQQPAPKPEAKKQSMAERLAAITGETEPTESSPVAKPAPAAERDAAGATTREATTSDEGMSLAPPGSDVLRDDERETVEAPDIDTSAIHLAPEFAASAVEESEAPPAPDISHLSMGEPGEDIPHLENDVVELDPDISHLSMGEPGEDIPHLELDEDIVEVDISGLDLAPEGSDVLEDQYRKKEDVPPPNTDHLSLEN